eukprot:4714235-Amphidinium_carterae.1
MVEGVDAQYDCTQAYIRIYVLPSGKNPAQTAGSACDAGRMLPAFGQRLRNWQPLQSTSFSDVVATELGEGA